MAPLNSTRVAWSIAIASLALWATSAPMTWGQMVATADHLFQASSDDDPTPQAVSDETITTTTTVTNTSTTDAAACPTPAAPSPAGQAPAPPANSSGPQEATFHLCGADAATAHAIEQLIAGRPFSATLSAHGDGCADLTIRVTSSTPNSGMSTSNLSVSLGGGQRLSIQIVTDGSNGTTHVNLTQGR